MPSYNKGEWSEFYTFIKILSDKKVYAADERLVRIEGIYYPVLEVLRKEGEVQKKYNLSHENVIKITNQNSGETVDVSSDEVSSAVSDFFNSIERGTGSSFEIAQSEKLMTLLQCDKIKSDSKNKEDIVLVIHDSVTLRNSKVGFSIKSNIGNPPTLLNTSKSTNFCFEILELDDNLNEINALSTHSKIRDRLERILNNSKEFHFSHLKNETFRKNLCKCDSLMPLILSEFLFAYFGGKGTALKDLTEVVAESKRIKSLNLNFDYEDLKFKMKHLLLHIALGMVPATQWDGFLKADGGYMIVKEDGDILCYHIYNIAQFSEYLFNNTRLDTPSSSRHDFGEIYEQNGKLLFNLNIQIRFI